MPLNVKVEWPAGACGGGGGGASSPCQGERLTGAWGASSRCNAAAACKGSPPHAGHRPSAVGGATGGTHSLWTGPPQASQKRPSTMLSTVRRQTTHLNPASWRTTPPCRSGLQGVGSEHDLVATHSQHIYGPVRLLPIFLLRLASFEQ